MRIIILILVVFSLYFLFGNIAEAHTIAPFSIDLPTNASRFYDLTNPYSSGPLGMVNSPTSYFPLIVKSESDEKTIITFSARYEDTNSPLKMPPGIFAKVEPDSLILEPGKNETINLVVNVAPKAPNGFYLMNVLATYDSKYSVATSIGLVIGNKTLDEIFSNDFRKEEPWKTFEMVGKYHYSNPPLPDQTFIANYRVINGTLESIKGNDTIIVAVVNNTSEKGTFELKFPRNFPYTNGPGGMTGDFSIGINGYGSWHYYHPEDDIVLPYVREELINKINRPPPYPDSYNGRDGCYFFFSVPFYTHAKIEIIYGANGLIPEPYHGDKVPDYCLSGTVQTEPTLEELLEKARNTIVPAETVVDSNSPPLKQFKAGFFLNEIKCKKDFEFVLKSSNNLPACVKPETKLKLIERGWANPGESISSVDVNLPLGISNPEVLLSPDPQTITVVLGINNTVRWVNQDNSPRMLVADDTTWTTDLIMPGSSKSITFNKTGTHGYHGEPGPWIRGTVIVYEK
ncbi:MAG TPA: hypothetical protein VLD38_04320 [Nitrosopumilaceae archaeon]|nr:hypothetical protein [Nitrosopumilaceae archaeon]